MEKNIKLSKSKRINKYVKPKLERSKVDLNFFNMDFYGILSEEATLLTQCSAPPSECVG